MEETAKTLSELRMQAMSAMRYMARADRATLDASGYRGKSNAEAVLETFKYHDKQIETALRKWEAANPGAR